MWQPKNILDTKAYVVDIFNKPMISKNLYLLPEAADIITKEVVRRGIHKKVSPGNFKILLPQDEVDQWSHIFVNKAEKGEITGKLAGHIIMNIKSETLKDMLPAKILDNAENRGIELAVGVQQVLEKELMKNTMEMIKSGLTIDEINTRNDAFFETIFRATTTTLSHPRELSRIISSLFPTIVRLTIKSIPEGADVKVEGTPLGKTTISRKPLVVDKTYAFIFDLEGYKTCERQYYVTPYPDEQLLHEELFPLEEG